MHTDGSVDAESQNPDINLFYNFTKGGIDTIDQICTNYSGQRKEKIRWGYKGKWYRSRCTNDNLIRLE